MTSAARAHSLLSNRGRGARDPALALCVGALTALGEPGSGLAPLFLVGVVVLALLATRARSLLSAARLGIAFGTGMFAVIMISSAAWGIVVPFALTLVGVALYGLPLALLVHYVGRRFSGIGAFVLTVAAWSLCMDLGDIARFPSKCEALSAIAFAPVLLAGCRLVGTNVVCGIMIAGAAGCGARLAVAPSIRRALTPLAASFGALLGLSGLAHVTAPAATGSITVGVPQMNVPSLYFQLRQAIPTQTDRFEELFSKQVAELGDVDLLALTETYDGTFPLLVPRLRQRFQNHAKLQHQAVLLTSYLVASDGGGYNAAGGIDAEGRLVGVHRKVNLAPFGEVELDPGSGFQALALLPKAKVGVLICQEALLPDGPRALVRDGANVLLTTTSDISFGSGILSFGHLAAARLRGIESGRSMVWASAGGPSGTSDRFGRFERAAPFREPSAARMTVDLYSDVSPFLRTAWLWPVLSVAVILGLLLRSPRASLIEQRQEPPIRTWRGALELGLASAFVAFASFGSPALVELVSGAPERAKQSVLELLGLEAVKLGAPSFARFKTDAAHSADGALAYYLDFYGLRTLPSSISMQRPAPTLTDLAQELERSHQFATREVALDFSAPPRTAALVRSKTGELGVLSSNSLHQLQVFLPSAAAYAFLTPDQARASFEPRCLLPKLELDAAPATP